MQSSQFRDTHIRAFLGSFSQKTESLNQSLRNYFLSHKSLGANDRRVIGDTVYGMIRWKSLLDHLAPVPEKRLDAYRNIDWGKVEKDATIPLCARFGMPEFLFDRLQSLFGAEKRAKLCRTLNGQAPTTVRVNLLKTSREALLHAWKEKFSASACLHAPAGIQLAKREPLFALAEFKEGLFELQDEGSQLVADLVECKPKDLVLDFCSGSGGKTLAFAHKLQGKGQIFLHDIRPHILQEAKKRLKRAGVQNGQFLTPSHPNLSHLQGKCDWVLIDVPCSGSGTLRRNVDQKWKIDASSLTRLTLQQQAIASEAVSFVKPGGRLVYATCSILPEENQTQVKYFISHLPLALEKEPLSLLPEPGGMDGFFAAVFRKV